MASVIQPLREPADGALRGTGRRFGAEEGLRETIDDKGDGAVARDVAGGAKAIGGNIERDDEPLFRRRKAEEGRDEAHGRHHGAAGHAGRGDHRQARQGDEAKEGSGLRRLVRQQQQRHREAHELDHGAGEVDRCAQRDDEVGRLGAHPVGDRLAERDGDGRRRGGGAHGRHVRGEHAPELAQRIGARHEGGEGELQQEQQQREREGDRDDGRSDDNCTNTHLESSFYLRSISSSVRRIRRMRST